MSRRHQLFVLVFTIFLAVTALTRGQAAADPFAGVFKDQTIQLDLKRNGPGYTGTITQGAQVFPCRAQIAGAGLAGAFESQGHSFDFACTLDGDRMTFTTGGKTRMLTRDAAPSAPAPAGAAQLVEQKLYALPPKDQIKFWQFSPDEKHFAYVRKRDKEEAVVLDGKPVGSYTEVDTLPGLVFSPDGQRLAFQVKKDAQSFVVQVSGRGVTADRMKITKLAFSPDGSRMACAAYEGQRQWVVVDGKKLGGDCRHPDHLEFTADGQHLFYTIEEPVEGGEVNSRLLRDGQFYGAATETPTFLLRSKHIAYLSGEVIGRKRDRYRSRIWNYTVCLDDKPLPGSFDWSADDSWTFGPDGSQFAYAAAEKKGGPVSVYLNGKVASETYEHVYGLRFSPQGKLAYLAGTDAGKWFLVVDGNATAAPAIDLRDRITWSPDGRQVVYTANGQLMRQSGQRVVPVEVRPASDEERHRGSCEISVPDHDASFSAWAVKNSRPQRSSDGSSPGLRNRRTSSRACRQSVDSILARNCSTHQVRSTDRFWSFHGPICFRAAESRT